MLVCFLAFVSHIMLLDRAVFGVVILQVVPILLQVSEMPPIRLKMLALISASTRVYALI